MSQRVALIPARGGSVRVPRKNIRNFLGTPIIARVIQTLSDSELFAEIVVSTDDPEIREIAVEAGASVPFVRPAALADGTTGARPVIQHAISELSLEDSVDMGVFYATSVLTTADDVRSSAALLRQTSAEFVMSVVEFSAPIERALSVSSSGLVHPRDPAHVLTRSQDLVRAFHDAGQFYWGSVGAWKTGAAVVESNTRAYVMESWRVVDIDTEEDWTRAEALYRVLGHGE